MPHGKARRRQRKARNSVGAEFCLVAYARLMQITVTHFSLIQPKGNYRQRFPSSPEITLSEGTYLDQASRLQAWLGALFPLFVCATGAMFKFIFFENFKDVRFDIVGIVAVLGETCTARTAQASSLSWHHLLPRFLPAPQALLRHEQPTSLPTENGMVVGVYSGNFKPRLNFFCRLLHPEPLPRNTVEYVEVKPLPTMQREKLTRHHKGQAFGVNRTSKLARLSISGCVLAAASLVVAICLHDGFALLATLLLAFTSSVVGFASWWDLDFKEESAQKDRENKIPASTVVIYYPTGAFRVVKCTEPISRLYFKPDVCKPWLTDNQYRFMALIASVLLMGGLLCMGNARTPSQIAFAASYILLNILYWAASALNPMTNHWSHGYDVTVVRFNRPRRALSPPSHQTPFKDGKTNGLQPNKLTTALAHKNSEISSTSPTTGIEVNNGIKMKHLVRRQVSINVTNEESKSSRDLDIHRRVNTDIEASKTRTLNLQPMRQFTDPLVRQASTSFTTLLTMFVKPIPEPTEEKRFTEALWTVIALTGSARWLYNRSIAPDTKVWQSWMEAADRRARTYLNYDKTPVAAYKKGTNGYIDLPVWNYDGELSRLLSNEDSLNKNQPPEPKPFAEIVARASRSKFGKNGAAIRLRIWCKGAREHVRAGTHAEPIELDPDLTQKLMDDYKNIVRKELLEDMQSRSSSASSGQSGRDNDQKSVTKSGGNGSLPKV